MHTFRLFLFKGRKAWMLRTNQLKMILFEDIWKGSMRFHHLVIGISLYVAPFCFSKPPQIDKKHKIHND